MSVEVMELFDIFAGTFGKEKAQIAVKNIEALINDHRQELATKTDVMEVKKEIREVELKIEQAKSSTIKWVVGWVAGLLIAYTGVIITVLTLLK
jgi:hypothetical protein